MTCWTRDLGKGRIGLTDGSEAIQIWVVEPTSSLERNRPLHSGGERSKQRWSKFSASIRGKACLPALLLPLHGIVTSNHQEFCQGAQLSKRCTMGLHEHGNGTKHTNKSMQHVMGLVLPRTMLSQLLHMILAAPQLPNGALKSPFHAHFKK